MADDLGDEWWLEEGKETQKETSQDKSAGEKKVKEVSGKKHKKKERGQKRKAEDVIEASQKKLTKKRKTKDTTHGTGNGWKQERKRISEVPEEILSQPGCAEDVRNMMSQALKDRLGQAALEDVLPNPESDFFANNTKHMGSSDYLKSILPNWRLVLKKSLYMKKMGNPCLLVVTSSAIRAVDMIRDMKDFLDGKCKVAKLFAKHMKVEDQHKFLIKTNCQVGVGTPGRIALLIKQGVLQLESLVAVVLDWNWRDKKLKRLSDIPEVKKDLVILLKDFLLEAVQGSPCKIALL